MAGLSSRFMRAGYTLPKYMLYIKDKSLFNLAVSSFEQYFKSCRFVFIARDVFDTELFIKKECGYLGIEDFHIIILNEPTRGQAETVFKGIEAVNLSMNEPILIFNIDTFRPGYTFPMEMEQWDGYLECFIGSGSNWSYVKTEDGTVKGRVIETAEKKEISNYCSTGIYFFQSVSDFVDAYHENEEKPINGLKELYVAPLYNFLIRNGKNIHLHIIHRNEVIFCGIPQEYINYLRENV